MENIATESLKVSGNPLNLQTLKMCVFLLYIAATCFGNAYTKF